MTLSPRAIEAALKAYLDEARDGTFANRICMEAALTAALAVDGLCLVPSGILSELRKRDDTIKRIGPRGDAMAEQYIAIKCAAAWMIVSAMLAAASTGDSPRQMEG